MATFMHGLLSSSSARWHEVDVLLDKAKLEEAAPFLDFHDVLCRASIVLIAAHLEGFIRDCAKAVISDINHFSDFKSSPTAIKRTFCSTFISGEDKESNTRTDRLIRTFDTLATKLTAEPFLFGGKHDDQKNASPDVIQKVARHFGVKKVFHLFAGSKSDDVFSFLPSEIDMLSEELRVHLDSAVATFPYTVDLSKFALDTSGPVVPGSRTMWETFLDNLMKERHSIAHGSSQLNGSSVADIKTLKSKVIVLQYGVMALLCGAAK